MRVYVQSEFFKDIRLVELEETSSFGDLREACIGLIAPDGQDHHGVHLFLEDEDEDAAPTSRDTRLGQLKKEHGTRVHLHRCPLIAVQIYFSGRAVEHKFRPSTTIGRVRQWAGRKLGMAPADVGEHVLQVSGSQEQPDIDTHIGALTGFPGCALSFDLVPAHRING